MEGGDLPAAFFADACYEIHCCVWVVGWEGLGGGLELEGVGEGGMLICEM